MPALDARQIGRTFGRGTAGTAHSYRRFRLALMWAGLVVICAAVAGWHGLLLGDHAVRSVIRVIVDPSPLPSVAELPLLHDPVGVLLIAAAGLTPIFCLEQVAAIDAFVPMNERNGALAFLHEGVEQSKVAELVTGANERFELLGSRRWSTATLMLAFFTAVGSLSLLVATHPLGSWNTTDLASDDWTKLVYDGWWANPGQHLDVFVVLVGAATYLFYFLFKQLCVGVIFARFAREAAAVGFGVTQNFFFDSDGYWGLRTLRRFMQWTYVSAVTHFMLTLGVFSVWFRADRWSVLMVSSVAAAAAGVVIYPSMVAYNSSVHAKTQFVKLLGQHARSVDRRIHADAQLRWIDEIWKRPHLPFRLRNTVTAATVYVVAPVGLAVLSSVLGGGRG